MRVDVSVVRRHLWHMSHHVTHTHVLENKLSTFSYDPTMPVCFPTYQSIVDRSRRVFPTSTSLSMDWRYRCTRLRIHSLAVDALCCAIVIMRLGLSHLQLRMCFQSRVQDLALNTPPCLYIQQSVDAELITRQNVAWQRENVRPNYSPGAVCAAEISSLMTTWPFTFSPLHDKPRYSK